jgi:ferritin heavy chain
MEGPTRRVLFATCRRLGHGCFNIPSASHSTLLTRHRLYHAIRKASSFSRVYRPTLPYHRTIKKSSAAARDEFLNKLQFLHGSDRKFGHLQPIISRPPTAPGSSGAAGGGQQLLTTGTTVDQQSSSTDGAAGTAGTTDEGGPGKSRIWQNFHVVCEAGLNRQINMELYAGYVYLSMASSHRKISEPVTDFCVDLNVLLNRRITKD